MEWRRTEFKGPEQIGHHADGYSIYSSDGVGKCILSSGAPSYVSQHCDTVKDAMEIAENIHKSKQKAPTD